MQSAQAYLGPMVCYLIVLPDAFMTLTIQGQILNVFKNPELQRPYGVHVMPVGHVLICGWSSHSVKQVDCEGRKKLATLATRKDGMLLPLSVFYKRNTNAILIGQDINNMMLVNVNT